MEHLRECVHFRPRTSTISSALRIRSEASFAIHSYFRNKGKSQSGFFYVHTPIITGNDCEGAGELFEIKNSEEFFNKKAYLTVSGQLQAEIFACALGHVYTFGPTFRAEKSHTQRHLAEFWMVVFTQVEPEMINYSLADTYGLAQELIKATVLHVLDNNAQDLKNLERNREELQEVLEKEWVVVGYDEAKKITQKGGEGLSNEEERFLTVCVM